MGTDCGRHYFPWQVQDNYQSELHYSSQLAAHGHRHSEDALTCKVDTRKVGEGYTFSATCNMAAGITVEVSGSSRITDSEHIVSDSHTVLTANGQNYNTAVHTTGHFVSADCGSVKPNDPRVSGK